MPWLHRPTSCGFHQPSFPVSADPVTYSQAYKRYVTLLLLVAYICNQTDRAIFGFVMEPIKNELGLSDTELGFLAGPALVLLYTTLGVPVARWADRSHRVNIMAAAIALWSCICMTTATIGKFWQLALTRVGVGVGEAGFSAIAMSVIGDYHSAAAERTRALSTFMLAIPIAGVVSSLMAGWINQVYGWRAVFIVAGVPGILLALLMKWTIKEPPRRRISTAADETRQPPLASVFAELWRRKSLRHLAIAQCLTNIVNCCMAWAPAFFIRNHGMSSGELGTWFALIAGVGGGAGIWLSGYLSGRHGSQNEGVKARLMAVATALAMPALVFALWNPSPQVALSILIPCQALLYFFLTPTMAIVQSQSAASVRATMTSVFILIQVLAGGVIGIQVLGILSDVMTPMFGTSASALRWSMSLTSLLALWAAVHFWKVDRHLRHDSVH
jgi:MFS family permease